MIRIVVNDETRLQFLIAGRQPCEIVDKAGNKLGEFLPDRHDYECPLSEAELDRIEKEGGGRPLVDILRDLESRS